TSDGASLKPDPSYAPMSSTPSARDGDASALVPRPFSVPGRPASGVPGRSGANVIPSPLLSPAVAIPSPRAVCTAGRQPPNRTGGAVCQAKAAGTLFVTAPVGGGAPPTPTDSMGELGGEVHTPRAKEAPPWATNS